MAKSVQRISRMAQTKGETFKNVVKDMDSSNTNLEKLRFGGMGTKSEERQSAQTPSDYNRIAHLSPTSIKYRPQSPASFNTGSSLAPWLDAQLKKTDIKNSNFNDNTSALKLSEIKYDQNYTAMTPKLSATEATQFILSPRSAVES